jgi:hypothetical protein
VASLLVTLAVDARRVLVSWRLADVAFDEGDPLGKLPLSIAGAPTLQLGGEAVAATDELGLVPLVMNLTEDDDGDQLRTWSVGRATLGPVAVSYLAEPVAQEPPAATPPLELRTEGDALSGALKSFVILPLGPEDLTFELRWITPLWQTFPPTAAGWLSAA